MAADRSLNKPLKNNDIIIASINDCLGDPSINSVEHYESYTAKMKQSKLLRGMDSAELRVLEVDENNKHITVAFHAVDKFNSNVSTARATYVTYQSMRNTVSQVFRKLF